ncbi:methylated-DNA--[protein]-cysteine S-methyltransferase [Helicobacter sp.]|uniref:methylated-DNA--[protein]-cysteine S-methyltransferase n=1 Tax=Helicobacter sp. TaxID=218 RepID=UPI0025C59674|nr:methylated-DNA--[protein]-cysteine S-methyltransferase [Helicobacter sp.]MCI5968390.1 methylated-DNA--[protein]-cysteine S-methyltransferase [Helicobacter sp.]MDY2585175.1 methylated-DNA--[protein]-cysteine S-methyltransferase [Helicobacter sp.]
MTQYVGIQNSPLGEILVMDNGEEILEVRFRQNISQLYLQSHKQSPLTLATFSQLKEYLTQKRQVFTLPLNPKGTAFQKSVWKILCTIPYGETLSYGKIADIIGNPKSARAIGSANHHNPIAILIPCHRVISANGAINGYASGIQKKIELLKLEGYKPKKGLWKL